MEIVYDRQQLSRELRNRKLARLLSLSLSPSPNVFSFC
ncbi:hypothetical protein CHELA1G11_30089 [Hyphomicrobiales bacterium]|nr:hypothetical protein CHELA1G2_30132 [Hyphomicrobiales bacterium]CAH1696196.1 hypothetical protein CHELA1G11_30089 [Hyphomicrobiales bacterium]